MTRIDREETRQEEGEGRWEEEGRGEEELKKKVNKLSRRLRRRRIYKEYILMNKKYIYDLFYQ